MPERWRPVSVGEVVRQARRPVEVQAQDSYRLLGMRWYGGGPFLRETVRGSEIKAKRLFVVRRADFIYNRLFAWKGSFGVIGADLEGSYVSGEFPLFECDRDAVLPEFLDLIFNRPDVWSQIERESTGSTATSRNRWKEERFLEWPIELPPPPEQRRIVDLIQTIDKAASSAVEEAERASGLLRSLLSDHEITVEKVGKQLRVIDMLDSLIGGVWGKPPDGGDVNVTALGSGVFGAGALRLNPEFSQLRSVSLKQLESRRLQPGDLVLERSGGGPDQPVGRVVFVDADVGDCIPSDFMRLLRPNPAVVDPGYLFWRLWSLYQQGRSRLYQRQTTSIRNLSVKAYLSQAIILPERTEQLELVSRAWTAAEILRKAGDVERTCQRLKDAAVSELLTGSHRIPDSYDELLEGAG